jgi:hypothetical protein
MTAIEGAKISVGRRRAMGRQIWKKPSEGGQEGKAVPNLKIIGTGAPKPAPIACFIDRVSSKGLGGGIIPEGILISRWFDADEVDPAKGGCGRCVRCQATAGPRGIVRCTLLAAGIVEMNESEAANYSPDGL